MKPVCVEKNGQHHFYKIPGATFIAQFKEVITLSSKCKLLDCTMQPKQINTFFGLQLEQTIFYKSSLFALKVQLPGILVDGGVQVKVFTLSDLN